MKPFVLAIAGLLCTAATLLAQSYQPQYPYDPYSGSAVQPYTPQYSSTTAATSGYGATTTGTGYYSGGSGYSDKGGGYAYSNSGGGTSSRMLTWGNLSAHYAFNDFKGDNKLEGDSGWGLDLNVKLMKPIYLHFGLDRITSSDPQARTLEITSFSAGAGVYVPVGSRVHLFGEVGFRYDHTSGDLEWINVDDISLYIRPGIRFAMTDKLELAASVYFNNTENLNDRVIELSAYYALTDWLDLGGGIDFGSDINTFRIGGRWRWD